MTTSLDEWIWSALAVAVGLLAAILALHIENVRYMIVFVFVQCGVFGYARPRRAWLWACLVAVCIPLSLLFNLVVTLPGPRELGPLARLFLGPLVVFFRATIPVRAGDVAGSCFAFIPAIVGAYAGAWMSRIAAPAR